MVDRSYGYSAVDFARAFAKLQVTTSDVGPFTLVPDGSQLFLLFNEDGARLVQRVHMRSFLVDGVPVKVPPAKLSIIDRR